MNQQVTLGIMSERTVSQPVKQLFTVWCREDGIESVPTTNATQPGCHGEQVQIMVAQHDDSALTQCTDPTQRAKGIRTAVDQVACEPERGLSGERLPRHPRPGARVSGYIVVRFGGDPDEQALERVTTALEVTNHMNVGFSHGMHHQAATLARPDALAGLDIPFCL